MARALHRFLQFDGVITLVIMALPFLVLTTLGVRWVWEHGWAIEAALTGLGLAMLLLALKLLRYLHHRRNKTLSPAIGTAESSPDWIEKEQQVFAKAIARIEEQTPSLTDWKTLLGKGPDVVRDIARDFGKKDRLDCSAPEALLLIEATARKYREQLLTNIPLANSLPLTFIHWIWDNWDTLERIRGGGSLLYRLFRSINNPPAALVKEIKEQLVIQPGKEHLQIRLQRMLLEELAFAAVELYSGRLKFSDEDLRKYKSKVAANDRKKTAKPPDPIRILLLGQTSTGKSSLINALTRSHISEIDAAPTTDNFPVCPLIIDDQDFHLVDSPGLTGDAKDQDRLHKEMCKSDLILWVLKANRPAREPDRLVRDRFNKWFENNPDWHKPEIITVVTAIDRVPPQEISNATQSITRDTGLENPRPVRTLPPEQNIDTVRNAIQSSIPKATNTQLNRRRLEAKQYTVSKFLKEIGKGGKSAEKLGVWIGNQLLAKIKNKNS